MLRWTSWLIGLAAMVPLASASANAITLAVDPASQAAPVGSPVSVEVAISGLGDAAAPSLGAFDLSVRFDSTVLAFMGLVFGDPVLGDQLDLTSGSLTDFDAAIGGTVNLAEVSLDAPEDLDSMQAGAFTLATLSFQILAVGTSDLEIESATLVLGDALGDPLTASIVTGSVTGLPEPGADALLVLAALLAGAMRRSRPRRALGGLRLAGWRCLLAGLLASTLGPGEARAAGQSCGLFVPCPQDQVCDILGECRHQPSELDERCGTGVPCASGLYCSAAIAGRCRARGQSGESCSGIGQGTCLSGLVCDLNGTCRHDPPESGEPCGIGVGCAGDLVCSAAVGGVCVERGGGGDPCSGLGQGTCEAGLACDVLGECRHQPSRLGELCGTGVACVSELGCSADVAGRCEPRDGPGEVCSGSGQGSCLAGLVCDANRTCRHDPPEHGEPCGIGVPCVSSQVCSADIGGVCQNRGEAGAGCSGFGQGSCEAGLVCDALRVCRHDPPVRDEPCGIDVACASGLFCQVGTQRCKLLKTAGEGCSLFNLCRDGLSCEPCFAPECDYPLQCFPNANQGAITEQQCLAIYSPALHQGARDLDAAMTWAAGDSISAGVAESQSFGVAYGPDGRYGCFTNLCAGISTDLSISAFVSIGLSNTYDDVAGSSTAFTQSAGAGAASYSTSQIFPRRSLDPFDIGPLSGTESALALGVSPEDIVIPFSAGVYLCETVLDTVIGGALPRAPLCGDAVLDPGEGCDDGNLSAGDGCSASCTVEALCGNLMVDSGEGCDDGNRTDGDGCGSLCRAEPPCGDGSLDLGEECDDSNTTAGDGCASDCAIEPYCGNALIDPGEACDDGNSAAGDGCGALCQVEAAGDLDGDGDVDRGDLTLLLGLRARPAGACPHCDLDGDGVLTVLDARKLALLCTRPSCAIQ